MSYNDQRTKQDIKKHLQKYLNRMFQFISLTQQTFKLIRFKSRKIQVKRNYNQSKSDYNLNRQLKKILQMSEVFDLCEGNFYRSIRIAQKALKSQQINRNQLQEITSALYQANQQLNKMEIQYSLNRNFDMKNKIDLFKQQLRSYKKQLNKKQKEYQARGQQKSQSLFEMQSHQKGINPLIQAKRQMYQNEAMSHQAAQGLKANNQKLMKNIARMDDIDNQLTVAQKLIGSIHKKLRKNKFVLWGTIGFLILVVAFIIYTYVQ